MVLKVTALLSTLGTIMSEVSNFTLKNLAIFIALKAPISFMKTEQIAHSVR
jgi:hypothetical protein